MTSNQKWLIKHVDYSARDRIVREVGLSTFIASVLVNRGIKEPEEVKQFLNPSLSNLHNPFLMKDMDKAVDRIERAVIAREKIIIYGDFDVDGIVSSAILRDFFAVVDDQLCCDSFIPDRLTEGYGLNNEKIREFASKGYDLIITVDCGIRAIEEVKLANSLGMDVIITDHHEQAEEIPPAIAVVDPMQEGCTYPYKRLAGVGVAYKLAWAVAVKLCNSVKLPDRFRNYLLDALPLVALGTICDVVPLLGENRVFTHFGLERMPLSQNKGLMALLDSAGILSKISQGKRDITVRDIAYTVGPRINAAGRMGSANVALELFRTHVATKANEISKQLHQLNKDRQELEARILLEAKQLVDGMDELPSAIVLARSDWHKGVLGIVASRLVSAYYRPTFLGKIEEKVVRGSARSIQGFDIVNCLSHCEEHMERYGGHAGAAGFTVPVDSFETFANALEDQARKVEDSDPKLLLPTVSIEAELPFSAINMGLVRQIEQLEPFGHQHSRPLFCAMDVSVVGEPRLVGAKNQHLIMNLRNDGVTFRVIAFNQGNQVSILDREEPLNILFFPKIDTFTNVPRIQLEVSSFHRASEE